MSKTTDERPSRSKSAFPAKGTKVAVLTLKASGQGGEKVFRLHKDRIVIGSVISADVRLVGDGVSPIHAVLELSPEPVVYDLASETGVFVNGTKSVTQALKPGDELTVGRFAMRFTLESVDQAGGRTRTRESEGRKLFLDPDEALEPLLLQDEREVEEIFDYRSTNQQALEVVMSWKGTILDVEHFVKEKAVTIGNQRRSDFAIPPILASAQYAMVTRQGESFTLNLDHKMGGVMQRRGKLQSIDEVRTLAIPSPAGYQVPLEKDDFAKISVGEVDFYMSFTSAPPRLRMRRMMERDPFFLKILILSMLLTGVTLTGLLTARVPQTLEAEQLPERITTVLYQPEKYHQIKHYEPVEKEEVEKPTPPKKPDPAKPKPEVVKLDIKPNPVKTPRPVPKEMDTGSNAATKPKHSQKKPKASNQAQSQAKEGAGAKAKGKEGTRGKPNAKPSTEHQTAATRPSPQGGSGAGSGHSQVPDEGNVDLLKGASSRIQNLLGNSAAQLGKGGERLAGFGGFNTQGGNGLALSGDGKGGGGDAASLGGLSDHGRGGGRVGTGQGAAGNGSGIIGGKARVAIHSGGPEEAVVMGSIDADAVEAALLAHKDEFRLCYEKEINAEHPYLAGRVGTSFTIGSSGRVSEAGVESTTLKNGNAERCILVVIKRIDFPIPRGGGIVQVTYPFKFSSAGK